MSRSRNPVAESYAKIGCIVVGCAVGGSGGGLSCISYSAESNQRPVPLTLTLPKFALDALTSQVMFWIRLEVF